MKLDDTKEIKRKHRNIDLTFANELIIFTKKHIPEPIGREKMRNISIETCTA